MAGSVVSASASASSSMYVSGETALGNRTLQNLGEPYIRLGLNQQVVAAINTQQAQEVLVIGPEQLTVIPNMAPAIMGLINHRSRIFWVIDLPQIFGLPPLDPRAAEYHLAVLNVGNTHVGIAIQKVQGITRISQAAIASPLSSDVPEALLPFLCGCVTAGAEQLWVLDAAAIAAYDPQAI